ncbi:MAG: ABC transporter [Snowella sp.]|jgi:putative ABC transport system permease protein|nr:MAG: ABC transporter [Snowella sp.]
MKIPLSWLQLTHEKMRLAVAIAGIAFADILMFMQLGFKNALFDSSVRLHKSLQGDIFILHSQTDSLVGGKSFSSRRLYEVMGVEGVKNVSPIYINVTDWKNPITKGSRRIFVVGVNPVNNLFTLPGMKEALPLIKQPDVVLFDERSRGEFGPIKQDFDAGKVVKTEVANRQITVGGLFALGASFGADGTVITSDLNFFRIFPTRTKGLIDVGVIQLEPNANLDVTFKKIKDKLSSKDIQIFTKEGLIEHEKSYWQKRTTIGFVFGLGTVMGFVVGTIIVYQILYTDVVDHLPEYATLKAMGYGDNYLLMVVFQEALLLAVIGFIPSLGFSLFFYANTAKATGLPILMTVTRAIMILLLTMLMCTLSGAIAVGKLRSADPADIF